MPPLNVMGPDQGNGEKQGVFFVWIGCRCEHEPIPTMRIWIRREYLRLRLHELNIITLRTD